MTTPNITRSRDSARRSAMFRGQRKVLAIVSTSCLLIFVVVKNVPYKSHPPGSFTSTCTSIESQLQRTNLHDMIECAILPRVLPTGEWFSNIEPLSMPNFTLLSAWLKTESPSAMDAPKDIPEMYMDDFSMGGMAKIDEKLWYFNQAYLGKTALSSMWTNETVLIEMDKASRRENFKYGDDTIKIYDGVTKYNSHIKGKSGIVIGSEDPWLEAILLHYGADKLLTVEFGKIISEHPQLSTITPKNFTESFLNGEIEQFDFGMSFSSLEHDGLGRYGDVLNPIGDLQTMAKMLSVIRPGGLFFIGIPSMGGKDILIWNAHRGYGQMRLPHMFAGWHFIDIIHGKGTNKPIDNNTLGCCDQHLYILQNMNGCKNFPA